MRSMTAAATIQSFIIRSFSSFSRRSRALVRAFDRSRSRISTSKPATCPVASDSAAEADEDAGASRWLPVPFNMLESGESCSSISSTSAVFVMSPTLDEQEPLTQNSVASCSQTSFLNYSHEKQLYTSLFRRPAAQAKNRKIRSEQP